MLIVGTALLAGGVYFFKLKMDFYTQSIQAEGTIIDIESSRSRQTTYYHPLISFQSVDGETYTFSAETGTSGAYDFTKGDKLMVRYLKEKPHLASVDSFMEMWATPAIMLAISIVLSLVGAFTCYNYFNRIKLRRELPRTGKLLQLTVRAESRSSKNKTEFVVLSDWLNPADSKISSFTSDRISFDPSPYLTDRLVDVWIDPVNPKKKHYMDISFLPEKA